MSHFLNGMGHIFRCGYQRRRCIFTITRASVGPPSSEVSQRVDDTLYSYGGKKAQNTAALSVVSGPEDNITRKLVEPSESESLGCSHFQGWTLQRQTSILDVNCVFSWHLIIVRICEVQCDNSMCVHRPGVIVWWQRAYPAAHSCGLTSHITPSDMYTHVKIKSEHLASPLW